MKSIYNILIFIFITITACSLLFISLICVGAQDEPKRESQTDINTISNEIVVAKFHGHKIRYKDIKIPQETNMPLYGKINFSLQNLRQIERRRLVAKIRDLAISDALHEYNIQIPKAEIKIRQAELIERYYGTSNFTQNMADIQNQRLDKMLELAEIIHKYPTVAEKKYKKEMFKLLPPEEWEVIKRMCATENGFKKFKKQYHKVTPRTVKQKYRKLALKQLKQEKVMATESQKEGLSAPKTYQQWLEDKLKDATINPIFEKTSNKSVPFPSIIKQQNKIFAQPQPVKPSE